MTVALHRGGPRATAQAYVDAILVGDCHVGKYLSNAQLFGAAPRTRAAKLKAFEDERCHLATAAERRRGLAGCRIDLGSTTTRGSTASVRFTVKRCADSGDTSGILHLVRESGEWRIDTMS